MASVATPEYVVEILNPTPALPPVAERTPAMVASAIESWPYWSDIKAVALKEYGIASEQFDALLPEYRRYLGLIMLGYSPLGMFSFDVDKVWHSHVLCTHLWADFCLRLHGNLINHVAQVPTDDEKAAICIACTSCRNCNAKCKKDSEQGFIRGPGGTVQEFAAAYLKEFGERPPAVWNLKEADGCAAE